MEPKVVVPATVEGDWIRTDLAGSGSWDGLLSKYPKAELTPEGQAFLANLPGRGGGGAGTNQGRRCCSY